MIRFPAIHLVLDARRFAALEEITGTSRRHWEQEHFFVTIQPNKIGFH